MTRVLALALLLSSPCRAAAQSPGWEEILGAADRAWEGGQVEDAERLYAAAIKNAESFGESDLRLARGLTALGVFYREQGRYRGASPLFGRALSVTEKAVPPGDPGLVPALNDLGAVWLQQGQAVAAEPLFRRSMAIAEKALVVLEKSVGPEHQRVGITLNNLAEVNRAQGRWEDAARLYPQAIAIVEKNLGPDHPTLAGLLENYAVVLRRARRDAEALEIDERARDIRARHAIQNPRR